MDAEADILSNGQMVKQVILLKQHRDRTLRRRRRVMRLAVNQQAAAGGRQKPGDQIQQGALPAPLGPSTAMRSPRATSRVKRIGRCWYSQVTSLSFSITPRKFFNQRKQQETEQQQEQGGDGPVLAAVGAYLLVQIERQGAERLVAEQRHHAEIANRQYAGEGERLASGRRRARSSTTRSRAKPSIPSDWHSML